MLNNPPRILIVDDEPDNLMVLEELLISQGYDPLCAESGNLALTMARQSRPDIIVLDVMMPEMDGFEVCRRLREDENLQTVPVIFLTALDDEDSRLQGLEIMGDDYLTKPINSSLLLTKMSSILRLSEMRSRASERIIEQQVKERSRRQISAAWEINEYLSEKFRLFVPEQFLDRIAPNGVESIQLGNATEEELTILFCDIRGFTAIAEAQSASETFRWINAFFTRMNQAIAAHHGFIDKFLGDAIMAVFDRPGNHAEDALSAAVIMQQRLKEFNSDRAEYNLEEPLNIGIGIHTGIGMIGTVGSDRRMDSTVIGDVVNTAARLEELTKLYGSSIIASETAIAHLRASSAGASLLVNSIVPPISQVNSSLQVKTESIGEFIAADTPELFYYRWVDRLNPRGKQQIIDLYEILGTQTHLLDKAKVRSLTHFESGIQAWRQGNFADALNYFQQVIKENPADLIAMLYVERCQAGLSLKPGQNGSSRDGIKAGFEL